MHTDINGIDIAYTDRGAGSPLVFVHGFPLSRGCWQPQIETLSERYRTIAPDLRGFGDSGSSAGTTTMDQFADDVARLLDVLAIESTVLVGHSMGGYVAFAFARRHPQRLRGLVLVGTRAGQDTPEAAAGRRQAAEGVRSSGVQGIIDAMAPKMFAPGNQSERLIEAARQFMAPTSSEGAVGALLGMAERADSTPDLPGIRVPTFVVTGDEDTIIAPAESEAMANAIPGARLQVIPDAGHLVAFEQAEWFNQELRDWLESELLGA